MKISDEIREWCDDAYSGRKIRTTKDLYVIADRIDAELVELPKDISTSSGYLTDAKVTHTAPDSLERIADELEELSVDSMVSDTNLLSSCALDLAKRIRRLAEREG